MGPGALTFPFDQPVLGPANLRRDPMFATGSVDRGKTPLRGRRDDPPVLCFGSPIGDCGGGGGFVRNSVA
jgi:hypothetical protein